MKILIVDDEQNIRSSLSGLLKDQGFQVSDCESGEKALNFIREQWVDLVFLDVKLPGMDGIETLENIKKITSVPTVIMISGQADLTLAVRAIKSGAYDFLEKPLNAEKVILQVHNVARNQSIEKENINLKKIIESEYRLVGTSPLIEKLRQEIRRAAPSDSRILIIGENGTGKELVAREIHKFSRREERPFIKVNCAAIPTELIESELFGHERGAFTGAIRRKSGMFEEADGGTLFLDEIGDMSLETQAKLLRVLQENEFQRVGGTLPIRYDIRFISATNKDLVKEIESGNFREDLYFRLNVIPIYVPPLRERSDDIPLLVHYFLKTFGDRNNKKLKRIEDAAITPLRNYPWPGNIRELKNLIERIVIMSDAEFLSRQEVINYLPGAKTKEAELYESLQDSGESLKNQLALFEKQLLLREFERVDGNVSHMAANLKTDRPNLHRKLKKYRIK